MFITLPANSECTVSIISGCTRSSIFMKLSCIAMDISSFVRRALCWLSSNASFHRSRE